MDKFNLKEYLKNNRLLNEENSPFVDSKGELIDDILYDYLMDDIDKDRKLNLIISRDAFLYNFEIE